MKSRLYCAVACFLLAAVLLFLAVPLTQRLVYPRVHAVQVTKTMQKGEQFNSKNTKPVVIGALSVPDTVEKDMDAVIGRYAAVDLVKGDVLFDEKISPIPFADGEPVELMPKGQTSILLQIKMIEGGEIELPESGDVIKLNGFRKKLTDIPALQFVRVLSVVETDAEGVITLTIAGNEKQEKYIDKKRADIFYASVMVRGNEELAEKLLQEQASYFEEG